ncbi:MAG: MFS transporter [Hyphomicrobiales bacterium]|nr:MFS transporter [Hyphomicrobiales bacterium]
MFLVVFASTLFSRVVDPVVPQIAADLSVTPATAALLSTAFTLPYALTQPLLGIIADFFGKTRLMTTSVLLVSLTGLVCALSTSFSLVFSMRVAAGLVAGGVFPVAMALVGDLIPVQQRQIVMGRLLAVGLTGNVLGAAFAGIIGDLLGWRGIFAVFGVFGLVVTIGAFSVLRGFPTPKPRPPFNLPAVIANFRSIFGDPRAKICFTSVFFEGIFIQGIFPYVAILLLVSGEARASIAGLVIAAFGMGGVIYSLSVPMLVARISERRLLLTGGLLAAIALTMAALHVPWFAQVAVFALLGFGFYLMHGCIQVHVTDLSLTARGAAASLHSSSFFIGQATGPVLYGVGYAHGVLEWQMVIGSAVIVVIALICSRFLRHRHAAPT